MWMADFTSAGSKLKNAKLEIQKDEVWKKERTPKYEDDNF